MNHEYHIQRNGSGEPHESHNLRESRKGSLRYTGLLFAFVAVHGVSAPVAGASLAMTSQPQPTTTARKAAPYDLTVASKDGFVEMALKAEGASLADIALDLSKRLKARVMLGPSLQKETISVNVAESPLEQALPSLAPRVIVDYELRQDARPAPVDIYLLGAGDPEPQSNTDTRGMSQGLLIEGHTEDTGAAPADDPLKVIGDKNQLTITSKKQPLAIIAMAIADVLGIPVEMKGDGAELVDVDIRGALAEDVIPRLSPNIRLHVRTDLSRSERTPLRLVVASPGAR
jgi:hypothetical protein